MATNPSLRFLQIPANEGLPLLFITPEKGGRGS